MSLLGDDWIGQRAQAFHGYGDGVAGLEPTLRSAAHAYAGWRACRYDVAGEERGDRRDVFDEVGNLEDQFPGVGVLQHLTVDAQANCEIMRVGDFVEGHDGRAHGAEWGEGFDQRPLRSGKVHVAAAR